MLSSLPDFLSLVPLLNVSAFLKLLWLFGLPGTVKVAATYKRSKAAPLHCEGYVRKTLGAEVEHWVLCMHIRRHPAIFISRKRYRGSISYRPRITRRQGVSGFPLGPNVYRKVFVKHADHPDAFSISSIYTDR